MKKQFLSILMMLFICLPALCQEPRGTATEISTRGHNIPGTPKSGSIHIGRDANKNSKSIADLLNETFVKNGDPNHPIITNVKAWISGWDDSGKKWLSSSAGTIQQRSLAYFSTPDNVYSQTKSAQYFPMKEGIVFGPAQVMTAEGPNTILNTSTAQPSDANAGVMSVAYGSGNMSTELLALIRKLTTQQVGNNACIQFDFYATASSVSFNYVWASEEYHVFAGTQWNDVFGFFVQKLDANSNPIGEAENIALINPQGPLDQSNYVSIRNINNGSANNGVGAVNSHLFQAIPLNQGAIEFNGRSTLMTATASGLETCTRYRMTLVVTNSNDQFLPSSVFLEANSFNLANDVTNNIVLENGDVVASNKMYANQESTVKIDLGYETTDRGVAEMTFEGFVNDGTKIINQDPASSDGKLPAQVTFERGERYKELKIKTSSTAKQDTPYTLIAQSICSPDVPLGILHLSIMEPGNLTINLTATPACSPTDKATISVDVEGGAGFYSYQLRTASGTVVKSWQSSNLFTALNPGDYIVDVKDLAYTSVPAGETNIYHKSVRIGGQASVALVSPSEMSSCDGIFEVEAVLPTNGLISWKVDGNATGIVFENPDSPKTKVTLSGNVTEAKVYAEGSSLDCFYSLKSSNITLNRNSGGDVDLSPYTDLHQTMSKESLPWQVSLSAGLPKAYDSKTVTWSVGASPVAALTINPTTGAVPSSELVENGTYIFKYSFVDPCAGLVMRNFYLTIAD